MQARDTGSVIVITLVISAAVWAGESPPPTFTKKPAAVRQDGKVRIDFAVERPTDVEVAVLDAKGQVVRHLAGGVLGGEIAPPAPLKPGLSQGLDWDLKDDFGRPAAGGPFTVRVRAGLGVRLGRTIGDDPYCFGVISSLTTDEAGRLYVMSLGGNTNQNYDTLRVFTPEGAYIRTVIPFPADLAPEAAEGFARWDAEARAFRPTNRSNLNPAFAPWGAGARIVSASPEAGILLTYLTEVYRLGLDGGGLKGPLPMWSKEAKLQNPAWNIPQLAVSPDGRYIYYSNLAGTKYQPKSFDDTHPAWPQGRVYRQDTGKPGTDPQPFYDLALPDWNQTKYWLPDAWNKRTAAYGINVDGKGHLYVCDLVNQAVVEVGPEGSEVSATGAPWPERVHVDPKTGNYYVICRLDRPKDGYVAKKLVKIAGRGAAGRIAAELPLERWRGMGETSALGTSRGGPVIWIGGGGNLICVRDLGESFEVQQTAFKPKANSETDFARIAVDPLREEVYTNDGVNRFWRYDGRTGRGEPLMKDGRPFSGVDLAVGYEGLLYVRTGTGYSGPLERYTRDLDPAPLESGSHVFSKYIYSRYGVGFCEKGVGVGPRGEVYVNFMYGWNQYLVAGFNPDGSPKKGLYLEGIFKPDVKSGTPADLDTAVVGPVPMVCGGVRVDLAGNIYVGVGLKPKAFTPPAALAKDRAYASFTGSVVKFGPKGGTFLGLKDAQAKQPGAPLIEMAGKVEAENALNVYPGIAPFSGGGYGNNTSSCVCRVPRFDIDRYGRLALPNAVTNSVLVLDNAGNLILEFGRYGNFDSQFVNPNTEAGKAGRPTVAVPEIPMGWPVGAGFSEKSVYVCDLYNRRVIRADLTWAAEAACKVD